MLKAVSFTRTLLILFFCSFLFSGMAHGAQKASKEPKVVPARDMPAARAGKEIKTEFFQLKIPSGWIMPYPVKTKHNPEAISAVFSDERTQVTVTLNVIKTSLSLKTFTDSILNEMKKSGLKPGMPLMENGLNKIVIRGNPQGAAWLGSSGKLCSATVVLSQEPNVSVANEILNILKPSSPNLFPKKIK